MYENPTPTLDDEYVSTHFVIPLNFDDPMTAKEAAENIENYIKTNGLPPEWVRLGAAKLLASPEQLNVLKDKVTRPRLSGEWLSLGNRGDHIHCECSVCGHREEAIRAVKIGGSSDEYTGAVYRFCPKCGSSMAAGTEESARVTQKLRIDSPHGRIEADIIPDDMFPGIAVTAIDEDGNEISCGILEWSDTSERFLLRVYSYENDNDRLTVGKLMELAPKPEPRVGKNGWTFDFVPCKIQPFRYGTCLAACCQCDDGYEVAYKFDYASNVLDVTLAKNDLSVFAKTIDMAKTGTSMPATLHEAESLATDAVTAYVTETDDINMMVPVFSRLRSWTDGNGKLQKLNRYSSHVYVSNYNHKVVHVDTDGKDGYDVLPGQKVLIKDSTVRTCHTVNTRHGKTRSQLIFIEHA